MWVEDKIVRLLNGLRKRSKAMQRRKEKRWLKINTFWLLLLRSEISSGTCAKLRTVAASNNRDHPTRSIYYCLFAPHRCIFVLRAHPVRGESHNQRNTTGEVATLQMMLVHQKGKHANYECDLRPRTWDLYRGSQQDRFKYEWWQANNTFNEKYSVVTSYHKHNFSTDINDEILGESDKKLIQEMYGKPTERNEMKWKVLCTTLRKQTSLLNKPKLESSRLFSLWSWNI